MISEGQVVFLFYATIILLIYINRKRFEMHGILALYRTKIGLKTMESISKKYREFIKILGYIGIGAGYIGLIIISFILIKNFFTLLVVPNAPSAVSPVIPGVAIPGTDFKIPLVSGWLALFVVVLIHEFSHGVVARAHDLKVKSSGIFFLGPLMGAFVEPDEQELKTSSDVTQYSILAAGPFSNMLLAAFIVVIFTFMVPPIQNYLVVEDGFTINSVQEEFPAQKSGLRPDMQITKVNNEFISNQNDFINSLTDIIPGESISVTADNKLFKVITTKNPNNDKSAYLGLTGSTHQSGTSALSSFYLPIHKWILNFLSLLGALSLGIGLINLFPIFITDGAKMLQVSMSKISKGSGLRVWKHANIFCLLILVISLFLPLFRWMFKAF